MYDIIIIGGGPAALTAGIYSGRRGMKTLVIGKDLGGQAATTAHIENYPGVDPIDGRVLMDKFFNQALGAGCEIVFGETTDLQKKDDVFTVTSSIGTYTAHSVILAFGKTPRDLHVPGEVELQGKGVSSLLSPNREIYRDKTVMVVGGGSSAVSATLALVGIAKKIYLVHRRGEFTAEAVLLQRLSEARSSVSVIFNAVVSEVKGDDHLNSVVVQYTEDERLEELAVDEVVVAIGLEVRADFLQGLVELDSRKQVIVDERQATSCEGVFAGGDVTTTPYKQIVISAGEGANAALSAAQYVGTKTGKRISFIDWGEV